MGDGSDFLRGCEVRVIQDGRRLGWLTRLLFDGLGNRIGVLWLEESRRVPADVPTSLKPVFLGYPVKGDHGQWLGLIRDFERISGTCDLREQTPIDALAVSCEMCLYEELVWCQSHWLLRDVSQAKARRGQMVPAARRSASPVGVTDCMIGLPARTTLLTASGCQLVTQGEPISETVICLAVRAQLLDDLDVSI
jgi:hypothetical protein